MAKVTSRPQGRKQRGNVVAAKKIKKKALKNRAGGGPALITGDARNRIIAKSRTNMVDARDKLAKLAKGSDARLKLQKIRNLKEGKLDVKTTARGGITIVTTTKGSLQLTTKKKDLKNGKKGSSSSGASSTTRVSKIGANLTKSISQGGKVTLSTKSKSSALTTKTASPKKGGASSRSSPPSRRQDPPARNARGGGGAKLSKAAKLDEELMKTHVNPVILKRTVRQNIRERSPLRSRDYESRRSRSPLPHYRTRERSRSPLRPEYDDRRSSYRQQVYRSYDDPREIDREEEIFRRKLREQQEDLRRGYLPPIMASSEMYTSPLQGFKVVVSNLQTSVTQDDLNELFGDIGALKKTRVTTPGTAEVIFINREDANKAIEVYHNRQLDGKPMKCQMMGATGGNPRPASSGFRLPSSLASSGRSRNDGPDTRPSPDISSIHKALFSDKKRPISSQGVIPYAAGGGSIPSFNRPDQPKFTVVMPKKNNRRQ